MPHSGAPTSPSIRTRSKRSAPAVDRQWPAHRHSCRDDPRLQRTRSGTVGDFIAEVIEAGGAEAAIERSGRRWLPCAAVFPSTVRDGRNSDGVCTVPFRGHIETKVIDSRLASEGQQIRRRRECLSCAERFSNVRNGELVMRSSSRATAVANLSDETKAARRMEKGVGKAPRSAARRSMRP